MSYDSGDVSELRVVAAGRGGYIGEEEGLHKKREEEEGRKVEKERRLKGVMHGMKEEMERRKTER